MTSTSGPPNKIENPTRAPSAPRRGIYGPASDTVTSAAGHRTRPSLLRDWIAAQRRVERVSYLIGAVLIVSGVLHLGMFVIDPRPLLGPLSWRKPVTFGVSFGLALISITWISSYLRLSPRARTWLLGLFAADCVLEVSGITVQAWRHVPSHFNTKTPLDAVIAYNLAAGGGLLVVLLGSLAITALRGKIDATPSMRLALRAGFALLVAGLASGVAMVVRGASLSKTGHDADAYNTAGYLKWFHGVTLHAVLVLPLLAWWLSRTHRTEVQRTRVVAATATTYVALAASTLFVSLVTHERSEGCAQAWPIIGKLLMPEQSAALSFD